MAEFPPKLIDFEERPSGLAGFYNLHLMEVNPDRCKVIPQIEKRWSVIGAVKRYAKATGKKFRVECTDAIRIWRKR
jgi:hypothetical protein